MDLLRSRHEPELNSPIAIIAFGGWNDACDIASTSADFVVDSHDSTDVFAEIEPDTLYDFQQQRPTVKIGDGVTESLQWPRIRFTSVKRPNDGNDIVVVTGPEPNFHWKTVARTISEVLSGVGVDEAILVGAYVGAVSHNDPVRISGVGQSTVSVIRHGLDSADYEGPTGMVGVVQGALIESGIRPLSLWAPAPPYLGGNPYPKAVLAIIEKISDITNLHIDTSELIAVDAEYTQRVNEALEDAGSDVSEFLEEIESYHEPILGSLRDGRRDADEPSKSVLDPESTQALVDEIHEFLEGNG